MMREPRTSPTSLQFAASLTLLIGLLMTACSSPQPSISIHDSEEVRRAINETYDRVKQGILDKDVEAVADMYTEDAVLYRADGSIVRGKEALRTVLKGLVNSGSVLDCEAQEVAMQGAIAIEIGLCASVREGVTVDQVKYQMLWREDGGQWRAFRDYVQGSAPRPEASGEEVLEVVNNFLAAISGNREISLSELFLAGGRLVSAREQDGGTTIQAVSFKDFEKQIEAAGESYLERIWEPKVEIRKESATVRAPYDFYRDRQFSHCGIDWFHLVEQEGRWRISSVQYTVETTGCSPSPLGEPNF